MCAVNPVIIRMLQKNLPPTYLAFVFWSSQIVSVVFLNRYLSHASLVVSDIYVALIFFHLTPTMTFPSCNLTFTKCNIFLLSVTWILNHSYNQRHPVKVGNRKSFFSLFTLPLKKHCIFYLAGFSRTTAY